MTKSDDKGFKCLKITLIVLYVLSLIGSIILIAISATGLVTANSTKTKDADERQTIEMAKTLLTVALVFCVITVLIVIIALYGVIKEHFCIMATITVLYVLGAIGNAYSGSVVFALSNLICAVLTGVYAYKIKQINKDNSTV